MAKIETLFGRKQVFWTVITVGVLAVTLYLADFERVLSVINSADKRYLLVTVLLGMVILFLRSLVWFEIFDKLGMNISRSKAFYLFSSGEFLNNVTPFGQAGGQPFMAYVVSTNSDLEYESSLASVVSADFMTGFPLLSFGLLSGLYLVIVGFYHPRIVQVIGFSVAVIVLGSLLVYVLWFRSGFIESKILKLLEKMKLDDKWLKKAEEKLDNIEQTFEMIGEDPGSLIMASFYAHSSFLTDILILYLAILSAGISVNPLYLCIAFPLANLSKSAPTSGGSGVYELVLGSLIAILTGAGFSMAVASALLYRLSTYWVAIIWGSYTLTRLDYSS